MRLGPIGYRGGYSHIGFHIYHFGYRWVVGPMRAVVDGFHSECPYIRTYAPIFTPIRRNLPPKPPAGSLFKIVT